MLSAPDIVTTALQATFVDNLPDGTSDSAIANQSFYVQSAANKAVASFGKLTDIYEHVVRGAFSTGIHPRGCYWVPHACSL
jgi:hypothetical protein